MLEVYISKHSLFRLKITVGCPRCCVCSSVLCRCWCVGGGGGGGGVLWCGVVCCGVVWCGVVWGGVYVCVFCVVFLLFLSILFFLFLTLSLFPSLFFPSSLFYPLFSSSFSLLFPSRHQTLWKEPINQHGGQLRGI